MGLYVFLQNRQEAEQRAGQGSLIVKHKAILFHAKISPPLFTAIPATHSKANHDPECTAYQKSLSSGAIRCLGFP